MYHYTTVSGLKGIIENDNIWATNINHLNDWKEFKESTHEFLKQFKGNKSAKLIEKIFDGASRSTYVFSLSSKKDDLSQWRAYSPNGNGFSIGFSYSKLREMLPLCEKGTLGKCEYDKKVQKAAIDNLIETILPDRDISQDDLVKLLRGLSELAPYHKNAAFRNEEEWRLVVFTNRSGKKEKIEFREGKTLIIPYYKIEFIGKDGKLPLPIQNIWIGPTPYMPESRLSLDILLDQYKKLNVKIEESKIPYREL
jgi:hypothetical protein